MTYILPTYKDAASNLGRFNGSNSAHNSSEIAPERNMKLAFHNTTPRIRRHALNALNSRPA
jgi:hypothetical protein